MDVEDLVLGLHGRFTFLAYAEKFDIYIYHIISYLSKSHILEKVLIKEKVGVGD